MPSIRLGTRGSPLAMWQAHHVTALLKAAVPDIVVELVEIQTEGDIVRDVPLVALGGQGAFTKSIQQALLENRVDLAVHSLKDLPTFVVEGLMLAAVPERGATGDAFVSHRHRSFAELPQGAVVATSSLRRKAQILHRRPDLKLIDIRGNVETRLRKLDEEKLDATILAQAGLERLLLEKHITEILDAEWMYPAVGQGALGLECRVDDQATRAILAYLDHAPTKAAVLAERAMLRGLGGGCHVPIGARTKTKGETLTLMGIVIDVAGKERIVAEASGPMHEPETLGKSLAATLMGQGAERLLAAG
ncbi:MAG: hydroxymethylbilane synthase [Gemmataceae bacterium]